MSVKPPLASALRFLALEASREQSSPLYFDRAIQRPQPSPKMPIKRPFPHTDSIPAVPPALPPSVEEAYRRKCVQLKNRTNEVEEANNAARLRLARIKRQVEKLRIERAFLLEQLSKRTSANVEDSEGSPSPPPTVRCNLRINSLCLQHICWLHL